MSLFRLAPVGAGFGGGLRRWVIQLETDDCLDQLVKNRELAVLADVASPITKAVEITCQKASVDATFVHIGRDGMSLCRPDA